MGQLGLVDPRESQEGEASCRDAPTLVIPGRLARKSDECQAVQVSYALRAQSEAEDHLFAAMHATYVLICSWAIEALSTVVSQEGRRTCSIVRPPKRQQRKRSYSPDAIKHMFVRPKTISAPGRKRFAPARVLLATLGTWGPPVHHAAGNIQNPPARPPLAHPPLSHPLPKPAACLHCQPCLGLQFKTVIPGRVTTRTSEPDEAGSRTARGGCQGSHGRQEGEQESSEPAFSVPHTLPQQAGAGA